MAKISARDSIRNLTQPGRFSQRALAAALGVSPRTIGRVIRGERELSRTRYAPDVFDTIKLLDREVRHIERLEARREGVKLPDLPVQFPHERDTWIDPINAKKKIPADTITYNIERANEDTRELATDKEREVFSILKFYRDRAAIAGGVNGVRLLVTTTKYKGKKVTHWWPPRSESQPDITDMSDEDLKDLIAEVALYIGPSGELHKLRIVDALLKL